MKTKIFLLLAALLMLVAPAGCIFSPDDDNGGGGGGGGEPALPFPGSEDQLMKNFRTVYETMEFNGYRDMLHPDFITLLQPATQEEFPDVGPTLDREEELIIAERMFSGEAITNSQGDNVPGISDISFEIFEQQGAWADSQPTDVIPNARFALFDVTFLFNRQGNSTLKVNGQIKFYVTSRDSSVGGVTKSYFQMVGQQDLTAGGTF